jgi:Domain of unknown function (DUF5060)
VAVVATAIIAVALVPAERAAASPLTLWSHPAPRSIDLRARFEVDLDVTPLPANPFDPGEMAVELVLRDPSGRTTTVDAYWFQDFDRALTNNNRERLTPRGDPYWKAAFTPTEPGRWRWRWSVTTPTTSRTSRWRAFWVSSQAAGPGFLHVSPRDPRYLAYDDGTPYFAIGENVSCYDRRGTYAYDDVLDKLAAQGATWVRVWMPACGMGIETADTGLGDYTAGLDHAWQLDHVFEAAAERGIAVQLVLLYHGDFSTQFNTTWDTNPYNAANGGPLASPEQFFTDPVARAYFVRRLRYIVARWGARTNLEAWELWNEVDITDNYDSATVAAWHRDVADFLRSIDPVRHPIATSFLYFFNDPVVVNEAGLDLVQQHFYSRSNTLPLFPDLAQVAVSFPRARVAQYGRPVLFAEIGVGAGPDDTLALDPEGIAVHDGLWAGPFGEAMGTSMPWWWRLVIDAEPDRYYPMFGSVSSFLRDVPWDREGFVASDPAVSTASGRAVRAHALVGHDLALLWVKDGDVRYYSPDRVTIDDARVALDALPGKWSAAWWDTWQGSWYSTALVEGGPGRTLAVPPFAADTAVRLVRRSPLDHYKCYEIRETKQRCEGDTDVACKVDQDCAAQGVGGPCLGFPEGVTAALVDGFEDKLFDVTKPSGLCTPVDENGEGIEDPLLHLKRYRIRRAKVPAQPPHARQTIRTEDQYGQHVLETLEEESLAVPTLASLDGPAELPTADHDRYKCYEVKELKKRCTGDLVTPCRAEGDCAAAGGTCHLGFPKGVQADLLDQFEHEVFDVKRPKLFCLPVDENGEGIRNAVDTLTGYQIDVPRGGPRHVRVSGIHLNDRPYGREVVTTIDEELLLVPSVMNPPASPSGASPDGMGAPLD